MCSETNPDHPVSNPRRKLGGWWFLLATLILYAILLLSQRELALASLQHFVKLVQSIAPILVIVMLFMWLLDILVSPQRIRQLLGKDSGPRGWLISIIGGVLSHGPVYAWYPLLESLQQQGTRPAFIAAFLYARSIKLPWLPMLSYYFGITYMLLLTLILLLVSPLVGWLTECSLRFSNVTQMTSSQRAAPYNKKHSGE